MEDFTYGMTLESDLLVLGGYGKEWYSVWSLESLLLRMSLRMVSVGEW